MKKGFTLIELLVVIAILAVILLIAVPKVLNFVEESKRRSMLNNEETIIRITDSYLTENYNLLPKNEGETIEVTFDSLRSSGYMKEMDGSLNDYDGYVLVTRLESRYEYIPHLKLSSDSIGNSEEDGLILHYTFDDFQEATKNEYNNPTFNSTVASAGWGHWGRTGAIGSCGQNQDKNFIYGDQPYSHWVANDSAATGEYLLYQSPAFEGGNRSLMAIIKLSDNSEVTNDKIFPAWNAASGGIPNNNWTSIEKLDDDFYLCKAEGIIQDGSNDLVGIYVSPGYKMYISQIQLEEKPYSTPFTPSIREDVVKDYSINNNTAILNFETTPGWLEENNNGYYYFDGKSEYITLKQSINTIINESDFTLSAWTKTSGFEVGTIEGGIISLSYGLNFWISPGSRLYARVDNGTSLVAYSVSDSRLLNNDFHFVNLTYSNSRLKMYIDGEKKFDENVIFENRYTNAGVIGYDNNDSSISKFKGYIDDVKIYNRALSAEEVKYQYDVTKYKYE